MTSNVQSLVDQAVKEKNRCFLLELLQTVTEGLLTVESSSSVEQTPKTSTSPSRLSLEKSVREKAKMYITSRGEQGHFLFTKNILEEVGTRPLKITVITS